MGACLSCLGGRKDSDEAERNRLLFDDPYNQPNQNYGSWNQSTVPSQNVMDPEDARREQQALDNITRWASDQIVEIFPHQHQGLASSTSQLNGFSDNLNGNGNSTMAASQHHDILLSMIPGDKSKRSIRIYPASRPGSKDAQSVRSKASSRMNSDLSTQKRVVIEVHLP